jgi:hypothetical protein
MRSGLAYASPVDEMRGMCELFLKKCGSDGKILDNNRVSIY